MTDTGSTNPGSVVNDAGIGITDWVNPGSAKVSDGGFATWVTSSRGGESHYLKAGTFGFSIPAGATIDGILAGIQCKDTLLSIIDLRLAKAGTPGGGSKLLTSTTILAWYTAGGSSDLWGNTLSSTDINNTGFGVAAHVSHGVAGTTSVDDMTLTIYYTTAAGVSMYQQSNGFTFTSYTA